MIKRLIIGLLCVVYSAHIQSQQIKLLNDGGKVSLRGLSVVTDRIIWVSGSMGSVGLSTDSGKSWNWLQVKNYEKSDFRDIEAFSDQEAVIMGITQPAVILRTTDGGKNWNPVFEDSSKTAFLDAMDFRGDSALAIGDPIKGRLYMVSSADKGKSWRKTPFPSLHVFEEGEAFFAASGSNLVWAGDHLLFVTGGKKSGLLYGKGYQPLALIQGQETTGANSIAVNPDNINQAYIVGGDFSHDTSRYRNGLSVQLNPFLQTSPSTPPHGYRSCVAYLDNRNLICCGISGVDYSDDGGMNWNSISVRGFHVCRKAKKGKSVFLAGPKSSIARLSF